MEQIQQNTKAAAGPGGGYQAPAPADHAGFLTAVGQRRDREAFIALFEHFAPRIKSYLIKGGMSPDAADELAQETMLTVWNRAADYDPKKAGASTWIFTIARNKRIDAFRRGKNQRLQDPLDDLMADPSGADGDELARAQESERIQAGLKSLPAEQADLLYKSFFENKSHDVIARELGLKLGTVKSRIRLALDKLRRNPSILELGEG